MSGTPEGAVKDAIKAVLEEYQVYYFMPVMTGYGRSGIPDILCSVYGWFVTIEVKFDAAAHRRGDISKRGKNKGKRVTTGAPTALQMDEMESIRVRGGAATLVVDKENVEQLPRFFYALFTLHQMGMLNQYAIRQTAIRLDLWYEVTPDL